MFERITGIRRHGWSRPDHEARVKAGIGKVWKTPGQFVDLSILPSEGQTLVLGASTAAIYFRTKSGNIYRIDPNGTMVNSYASKITGHVVEANLFIKVPGVPLEGRITVGEPFKLPPYVQTTVVTEIVAASHNLEGYLDTLSEREREIFTNGPINTIIEEFEKDFPSKK